MGGDYVVRRLMPVTNAYDGQDIVEDGSASWRSRRGSQDVSANTLIDAVLHETTLCYTRLRCATRDHAVLHETTLCYTRPRCATRDYAVLHETALCLLT